MGHEIKQIYNIFCVSCGSTHTTKNGKRKIKNGVTQRYKCLDCSKRFTWRIGFEKKHYKGELITLAIQMYFSGQSLSKVAHTLKMLGISPTKQTIWNWINQYSSRISTFLETVPPDVGESWRSDEMYTHVKGKISYLFMMMDDDTRYILSQELAKTKEYHDAYNLFNNGRILAGKKPSIVTTDGLKAYKKAFNRVFYSNILPRTTHNSIIKLTGDMSNNLMERVNNTYRDREKTFRGLQSYNSPLFKGLTIYYNCIRPHEALKGKTPADMAGINIHGDNKWYTLIQNASLNLNV